MPEPDSEYTVSVQIIRVYHVRVTAPDESAAVAHVSGMSASSIEEQGQHKDTTTDYVEVVD